MDALQALIATINSIPAELASTKEESFRCTIEGHILTADLSAKLSTILASAISLSISPSIIINGEPISADLFDTQTFEDISETPWRIIIGKNILAESMRIRESEQTFLFFSEDGYLKWINSIDPFSPISATDPTFNTPTTIWVAGLDEPFGGPLLWILPLGDNTKCQEDKQNFPDGKAVRSVIHIGTTNPINISPLGIALTWGAIASKAGIATLRVSTMVLAACLTKEISFANDSYTVVVWGTKKLTLTLTKTSDTFAIDAYTSIKNAVLWIFQERSETRHRLIMDRLSIDIPETQSLISGISQFIDTALDQARDSYAFVILERKDAYYKEIREIMKDMRAQADLYATKTRDLISSLSRDILSVFVLVGFSFVSKFDINNIFTLIKSREFLLLTHALALYFLISMIFQISAHWRDSYLSFSESKNWLTILQGYTSRDDIDKKFLVPITKRKRTFTIAMFISAFIYISLAICLWNFPGILTRLLGTPPKATLPATKSQLMDFNQTSNSIQTKT